MELEGWSAISKFCEVRCAHTAPQSESLPNVQRED
jgi:hypothetical protein